MEAKQQINKKESSKFESYFVDQDDDDSDDPFENAKDASPTSPSLMDKNISGLDIANLIDIELIKLLKYCAELKKFQ